MPKIKRASGFFRIQDARAALPQNCSIGNVRLSGESENSTRVPICSTKVPRGKVDITGPGNPHFPPPAIPKAPWSQVRFQWEKAIPL
jgi:hypothetical protein